MARTGSQTTEVTALPISPVPRGWGCLHDGGAVLDRGHLPGLSGVGGVVEAGEGVDGRGADDGCLGGGGEGCDDERGGGGAEGDAGGGEADEGVVAVDAVVRLLDECPGEAAVGGAEQAFAVVGVGGVVGVAGAGDQHRVGGRLHGERADGERRDGCWLPALALKTGRVSVSGSEGDRAERAGGVGGLPDAAAGGADVDGVAGGVVGVGRDGGDAAGEVVVGGRKDGAGAERLPGGGEVRGRVRGGCCARQRTGGWAGRVREIASHQQGHAHEAHERRRRRRRRSTAVEVARNRVLAKRLCGKLGP